MIKALIIITQMEWYIYNTPIHLMPFIKLYILTLIQTVQRKSFSRPNFSCNLWKFKHIIISAFVECQICLAAFFYIIFTIILKYSVYDRYRTNFNKVFCYETIILIIVNNINRHQKLKVLIIWIVANSKCEICSIL